MFWFMFQFQNYRGFMAFYGIPERTKLSIKIHGQIVQVSWSKCNNFMLMVCARFHGHGQIPFSCSWCVQDFMVMVRFHFHAHGVCKISWPWSDSIFMLMVRFHSIMVMVRFHFSCSWTDFRGRDQQSDSRGGARRQSGTRRAN